MDVPRLPYNCAVLEKWSRECDNSSSLLKSESTLATLNLAWNWDQDEGSTRGHQAFRYFFFFLVCLDFRNEGRYMMKTHDKGKGLEISDF